jgi:hypothetical protein
VEDHVYLTADNGLVLLSCGIWRSEDRIFENYRRGSRRRKAGPLGFCSFFCFAFCFYSFLLFYF